MSWLVALPDMWNGCSRWILGSVRGSGRGGSVEGCVGREDGADNRTAWGTNHDANKGGNSARGAPQETGIRAGGGTDASPNGSAEHKADQGMLTTFGARGPRGAVHALAFSHDVGAVFLKRERFIGDGNKFSDVLLQAGFDHFDPLAGLQTI